VRAPRDVVSSRSTPGRAMWCASDSTRTDCTARRDWPHLFVRRPSPLPSLPLRMRYNDNISARADSRLRRWTSQNGRDAFVTDAKCMRYTLHFARGSYTIANDPATLPAGRSVGRLIGWSYTVCLARDCQLCPCSMKSQFFRVNSSFIFHAFRPDI